MCRWETGQPRFHAHCCPCPLAFMGHSRDLTSLLRRPYKMLLYLEITGIPTQIISITHSSSFLCPKRSQVQGTSWKCPSGFLQEADPRPQPLLQLFLHTCLHNLSFSTAEQARGCWEDLIRTGGTSLHLTGLRASQGYKVSSELAWANS